MELDKTKLATIIAIAITALLASGFTIHKFSADDPDPTHYCDSLKIMKFCDHVSSSGITCYAQPDSRKGSKLCDEGWKSLAQYGVVDVVTEEKRVEVIKEVVAPPERVPDSEDECCPVGGPCYKKVGGSC